MQISKKGQSPSKKSKARYSHIPEQCGRPNYHQIKMQTSEKNENQ
jgi:hypothetical protein